MQNPIVRILGCFFRFVKHIFYPNNIIISNIIPFLAVLSLFLYQFLEFKYSILISTAKKIASNTTVLNAYSDIISNQSFIYFVSDQMKYPSLSDDEIGIHAFAAIMKRSIDYCQWLEEGFDSTDKLTRTRRYMKVWIKETINSSEFMDLRYYNPLFNLPFSDTYIYTDSIPIGHNIINSSIFRKNKNDFAPFVPDNNQSIIKLSTNISFVHIGDGHFYYYFNKSNNTELSHKNLEDCTPGDIRIQISIFSPQVISVVGKYNNLTREIYTDIVNNLEFGALEAGNVTLNNLLIKRHKKIQILAMTIRSFMFFGILFFIIKQSATQLETIIKFLFASFLVLYFRFLIWNDSRFIYLSIFLTFITFIFVLLLSY